MSDSERWEKVARDAIENTRRATAVSQQALAQRDAARLELRALEWIRDHAQYYSWPDPVTLRVLSWFGEVTDHTTYASAARALGWEG